MNLTPQDILFEDNHLLVVNKPNGLLVQGDRTGDETLSDAVKEYIARKYKKPGDVFLGVVHRLDRPVSGVVIFTRTSKALERMNKLFHDREIKKTYWALVKNRPPQVEDELVHWIRKNTKINKALASDSDSKGGQKAILTYRLVARLSEYYLLEVKPETGRPHQIRVQLAKIGCPISGDVKYGSDKANRDASIHLHARSVEFIHPVKKEPVRLTAGIPSDDQIWQMFKGN
jgi:23S rRNA pseudouridine1911/1915/1917 synthase